SHGKTTVTSMIAVMLTEAGLDPTAVIGGRLDVFGSSARLGKGDLLVAEADESDRSFLLLLPSIAVVTNIDREHLDQYRDLEEIKDAFASFMNKTPFYGAVIACYDPPWRDALESIRPRLRRRLVTYGVESGAAITATDIAPTGAGTAFRVYDSGKFLLNLALAVPGRHNVQNALAAVGAGLELGLDPGQIQRGLARFRGADRRFQVKAETDGITIVDDYGHHPAEIRATLDAAAARGASRIWAIFQPHRFSRTRFLMDDFAAAFAGCERVYVLDIYPAGERPLPGVDSAWLARRMNQLGCAAARYAPSEDDVVREVLAEAEPGVMIITIGAGSVGKLSGVLADGLVAAQELKNGAGS
ncbi:MAG: UDP-N-acetylmuramate--L-alanine ligase, partial [Acidobacteriota bacterium]|nr:UDP-N-acetylmuramate--L-alanine ligase [Acidobacteriota bacterium]